jgi:hypothetical protein
MALQQQNLDYSRRLYLYFSTMFHLTLFINATDDTWSQMDNWRDVTFHVCVCFTNVRK